MNRAIVKAIGKPIDVKKMYRYSPIKDKFMPVYMDINTGDVYHPRELAFDVKEKSFPEDAPDYRTQLKHQYAGMAMEAMLANPELLETVTETSNLTKREYAERVASVASIYATALVNQLIPMED